MCLSTFFRVAHDMCDLGYSRAASTRCSPSMRDRTHFVTVTMIVIEIRIECVLNSHLI